MSYFLIKRKSTNAYYSVRDESGRPAIIAFKSKQRAQSMSHVFKTVGSEKQKLVVEPVPHDFLVRQCKNTLLPVIIFATAEDSIKIEADIQNIDVETARDYLRNKFLYF